MSLRALAEADLATVLEDEIGFGWDITVTDPDGNTGDLVGMSGDIGILIDQETGVAVAGRQAHVSLRISTLASKGLGVPVAIADPLLKPWRFTFKTISGTSCTFAVRDAMPDQTVGIVTCTLEHYASA